jgi:PAS domain S-box-containing protein
MTDESSDAGTSNDSESGVVSQSGRQTDGPAIVPPGGVAADGSEPHVLLLLGDDRNRRLLSELLAAETTVTATTHADRLDEDVDLCIVDRKLLARHRDAIVTRRAAAEPLFFPVVLIDRDDTPTPPETWAVVDEVVSGPVSRVALRARLRNLLVRRRQSRRLADRETELEMVLAELRVRDRAITEAPIGISIAGPTDVDNPLVYVNDAFCELTGYDRSEIVGRNCRFLQGKGTDEGAVRELRRAIDAAEPVSVDLVNYTRDGERFWNEVDVAPVRDDDGEVTHFIGFQTDITERKLHEQRVSVLNRVLRHNLRNELNIIDGYIEALATDGVLDRDEAVERIEASVDRLVQLGEEVRHVDRIFSDLSSNDEVQSVSSLLEEIRTGITAQCPGVTVHVDGPDRPVYVSAGALSVGCVDYLAMLLGGNAADEREVSVVATHDTDAELVRIELDDDGTGLTEAEWAVVETGYETPLEHTDRLGLWVLRWVTTMTGGELVRSEEPDGGLQVQCPVRDPPTDVGGNPETRRGDATDGDNATDDESA